MRIASASLVALAGFLTVVSLSAVAGSSTKGPEVAVLGYRTAIMEDELTDDGRVDAADVYTWRARFWRTPTPTPSPTPILTPTPTPVPGNLNLTQLWEFPPGQQTLVGTTALTTDYNGVLYIYQPQINRIRKVSPAGIDLGGFSIDNGTFAGGLGGLDIAVASNGDLLLTNTLGTPLPNGIERRTLAGDLVESFGVGSASRLEVAANGNIFFLEETPSLIRVHAHGPDGVFARAFGSKGSAAEQIESPLDLIVLGGGTRIGVLGNDNRLQYWAPTGVYMGGITLTGERILEEYGQSETFFAGGRGLRMYDQTGALLQRFDAISVLAPAAIHYDWRRGVLYVTFSFGKVRAYSVQ